MEIVTGICIAEAIVMFLIVKYKTFKEKLEKCIIKVEEESKTKEGRYKLVKALGLIKKTIIISRIFSESRIIRIIEKTVMKLNSYSKASGEE